MHTSYECRVTQVSASGSDDDQHEMCYHKSLYPLVTPMLLHPVIYKEQSTMAKEILRDEFEETVRPQVYSMRSVLVLVEVLAREN